MSCSVNDCSNPIWFKFPRDELIKNKWLQAIRRPDFQPKSHNGLCIGHFQTTDLTDACLDNSAQKIRLRQAIIPSVFAWSTSSNCVNKKNNSEFHFFGDKRFDCEEVVYDETKIIEMFNEDSLPSDTGKEEAHKEIQSGREAVRPKVDEKIKRKPRFDIEELKNEPSVILEFTGLECYDKFKLVFFSLGKKVHRVKCGGNRSNGGLSKENQLFLTLWKLQKNCTDSELSIYFNISKVAAGNIFKAWIKFMAYQWSKINVWPSKQLVQYYMPENFKKDFPQTRVIIDGTEVHVQRPKNCKFKQSTFSYYKNDTNVKAVLGSTPGGLLCYCSDCYGGSTSDRQVVERSGLQQLCEPGDIIMADRGFTVQDIFAPYNVTVAIPHFTKGKGYLPLKVLLRDRKLSRYRVHIERIIGLLKTYKILSSRIDSRYLSLTTEITKVCFMLCNFRDCIMKNN